MVEIVEDDRLIEQVFGDEEVGDLRHPQGPTVGVELQCEVNLVQRVHDDLVLNDAILVDYSLEVNPHFDVLEITKLQALHEVDINPVLMRQI